MSEITRLRKEVEQLRASHNKLMLVKDKRIEQLERNMNGMVSRLRSLEHWQNTGQRPPDQY